MPTPGTPPPARTPNPAIIIPTSIPVAAKLWNNAIASVTPTLDLLLCESANSGCSQRNTDNYTVAVKVVNVSTKDSSQPQGHNFNTGCGLSVACVKFKDGKIGIDGQLFDMALIIEEPAWEYNGQHVRVRWTDKATHNLTPGQSPNTLWFYIGAIMLHELGHTLGLPDFPNHIRHLGVMKDNHTYKYITSDDLDYLKRIYQGLVKQ